MTAPAPSLETEQGLLRRARAIGLFAEVISAAGVSAGVARELADVVRELGAVLPDLDAFREAVKSLDTGAIPAYETSYEEARGAQGGTTFQMADVAGFYRAFGFAVTGERPDHIVPELEFVALLMVKEAHARLSGEVEATDVCATAREKFVREHVGLWLPLIGQRADETGHAGFAAAIRLVMRLAGVTSHRSP